AVDPAPLTRSGGGGLVVVDGAAIEGQGNVVVDGDPATGLGGFVVPDDAVGHRDVGAELSIEPTAHVARYPAGQRQIGHRRGDGRAHAHDAGGRSLESDARGR